MEYWVGKETFKDQHTASPASSELSQPDGVASAPQPQKAKFQNNTKFKKFCT